MSEITSIGERTVATLIGSEVRTTTADASLHDVADLLTREDISALVVEDAGSDATAVVTERDLVRALAERLDPASTTVGQVASTELIWCDAGSSIAEVALRMTEDFVRHVLVEDDGDLVGIVSARDVLGAYAGS